MTKKNRIPKIIPITFILICLIQLAYADMGPKPTVDIFVKYNGNEIKEDFKAKMLECANKERVSMFSTIEQLNVTQYDQEKECYWMPANLAWGGECKNSLCHFNYMPPKEFKLAVYLPSQNKIFISNKANRVNFYSTFQADVSTEGSVTITETTPILKTDNVIAFIKALVITLFLELLVALIFIHITKISKKIIIHIFIANLITLPFVWFVFPLLLSAQIFIPLSEIFAITSEAYFIHYFNKEIMTLKRSFVLSIIMNLVSLFVGGMFFLMSYLVF